VKSHCVLDRRFPVALILERHHNAYMSTAADSPDEPTGPLGDSGAFRTFEPSVTHKAGDSVGAYKLISQLGEGGFGEVWLAERREPFVQRVALKLIKPGMDSKSVIARFEQERQALAVMNHPHIAKVLDGGLTPQGRPYFAMEYVKGEPITEFCDARKLGVKARLELFAQACEAVQHAHVKGIVHRDIKPSNILAYEVEGEGPALKVIDFGVAKAMSQPLTDKTIFTETGQMIGTPAYMSPEQADPSASGIDTRSDIYSLGVLLYELLTGTTPFDPKTLRAKAYAEIQRVIREEDPPTPSARISTISTKDANLASRVEKARGVALRELARELRSELEWIPLKAMRKEPAGRYQSATLLAEDVRNYLAGRPLVAAPESGGYRLRKFVRRNPLRAAALVAVPLVLAVALGALALPAYRAYDEFQRGVAMQKFTVLAQEPDPEIVTDALVREKIKATGKPWKIRHDETGIVMLLVPPGEFLMGSPETEPERWKDDDRERQHRREIRHAFYLSEREVSQEEWLRLMPENPSYFDEDLGHPVQSVSWRDCQAFCKASNGFFRLPSESEWEYACRAGTSTPFSFGENITTDQANYDGRRPYNGGVQGEFRQSTVPCGSLPANPWGFHEMHGNVFEWVEDASGLYPTEGGTEEPAQATRGAKSGRVLRGGSWNRDSSYLRSSDRNYGTPGYTSLGSGFRVARAPL
jgi:serine/threonine protein kinase/formylglycine-generating enzyme required for sulfatase activity